MDKEPGIFTVEQGANLLKHADKFGLLKYISIGLFAGLRSAEMMTLQEESINLGERQIIVGAVQVKSFVAGWDERIVGDEKFKIASSDGVFEGQRFKCGVNETLNQFGPVANFAQMTHPFFFCFLPVARESWQSLVPLNQ